MQDYCLYEMFQHNCLSFFQLFGPVGAMPLRTQNYQSFWPRTVSCSWALQSTPCGSWVTKLLPVSWHRLLECPPCLGLVNFKSCFWLHLYCKWLYLLKITNANKSVTPFRVRTCCSTSASFWRRKLRFTNQNSKGVVSKGNFSYESLILERILIFMEYFARISHNLITNIIL